MLGDAVLQPGPIVPQRHLTDGHRAAGDCDISFVHFNAPSKWRGCAPSLQADRSTASPTNPSQSTHLPFFSRQPEGLAARLAMGAWRGAGKRLDATERVGSYATTPTPPKFL